MAQRKVPVPCLVMPCKQHLHPELMLVEPTLAVPSIKHTPSVWITASKCHEIYWKISAWGDGFIWLSTGTIIGAKIQESSSTKMDIIAKWNFASYEFKMDFRGIGYIVMVPWCPFHWLYFHPWWRHQMEAFSTLLALCVGNSPVPSEFSSQRPVMQSFWCFLWSTPE